VDAQDRRAALARLAADLERGAITHDDYTRFAERLGMPAGFDTTDTAAAGAVSIAATSQTELASWGRRAAAKLADFVFIVVALFLVLPVSTSTADGAAAPLGATLLIAWLVYLLLYPWFMVALWGQTPGKMALGIKVVRGSDEGGVGWLRALGRYASEFALGLFSIPLLLSYLWPLWDSRKETLHDKMAGTIVTRV
jgi:uncharacterized RDD family membrane protein YckC